tara:strand:+ start:1133 stop:1387 length:255 start_codon:yes stop_codon:yes gene_type:complete
MTNLPHGTTPQDIDDHFGERVEGYSVELKLDALYTVDVEAVSPGDALAAAREVVRDGPQKFMLSMAYEDWTVDDESVQRIERAR